MVSDFSENSYGYWRIDGLGFNEKRGGSIDLHNPIQPPLNAINYTDWPFKITVFSRFVSNPLNSAGPDIHHVYVYSLCSMAFLLPFLIVLLTG